MTEPAEGYLSRPARPLAFTGLGGPNPLITRRCRLMGWSLIENTGAGPSVVIIRDGQDTSGRSVATIRLNASESIRDWFGPMGILCDTGVYTHQFFGITDGTVYVVPL